MISLDDLINEGDSFEIKRSPMSEIVENGKRVIYTPTDYIENGDRFFEWVEKSKRYIAINYPDDIAYTNFENISKEEPNKRNIYSLVAILKSLKEIPVKCSQHIQTTPGQIVINNQNNLNVNIIIDSMKEEIGRNGLEELKKIQGKNSEEKKKNIINKLKTLGESTLSNIIANILTNPSIWSQL
jgi:hypothetical protein